MAAMPHQIFYNIDLAAWVYGTIPKPRKALSWHSAWVETHREIGGVSKTSGEKHCPMIAARTLYEMGRIKNGGLPFRHCEILELWNHSRKGTYAILATRLLRASPHLSKTLLWSEIQRGSRFRSIGNELGDTRALAGQ